MNEWMPFEELDFLGDIEGKDAVFLEKGTNKEYTGKLIWVNYLVPKDWRIEIEGFLWYIDEFSHYKLIPK